MASLDHAPQPNAPTPPMAYMPMALARAQAEFLTQIVSANMRLWRAAHEAAWNATQAAAPRTHAEDVSPCVSHAFADLQACGDAIVQAQIDALEAARRTSSAISLSRA